MARTKAERVAVRLTFAALPRAGGMKSTDLAVVEKIRELKETMGEIALEEAMRALVREALLSGWPVVKQTLHETAPQNIWTGTAPQVVDSQHPQQIDDKDEFAFNSTPSFLKINHE